MKNITFIFIFILSNFIFAQKNNWQEFSNEEETIVNINKTKIYEIENFTFNVIWDSKLSYSENIGFYGGIKKLTILKKDKQLQIIYDMEDNVALGNIYFSFSDYNLDGHIDFSIPLNCGKNCWKKYYLFNPKLNQFEHKKDWDYLRIQKIDKKNKMILSEPDGNATEDNRKIYKIKGLDIIEIK